MFAGKLLIPARLEAETEAPEFWTPDPDLLPAYAGRARDEDEDEEDVEGDQDV